MKSDPLLIYGLGISGRSAAQLAISLNIPITLYDDRISNLDLGELSKYPILNPLSLATQHPQPLVFMPSPGIAETHKTYQKLYKYCHYRLRSEVDFGLQHIPIPILAVSGTNGKTTCCAMIKHLFAQHHIAVTIAGNSQIPTTELAQKLKTTPLSALGCVLELSSYQISASVLTDFDVTILTHIDCDHLHRHGSMDEYVKIKWRLSKETSSRSQPRHLITTSHVCDLTAKQPRSPRQLTIVPSSGCIKELKYLACHGTITFAHQLYHHYHSDDVYSCEKNDQQKHTLYQLAHSTAEELMNGLDNFSGLEHRMERITPPHIHPCLFINDSKSTNLSATAYAIRAVSPSASVLILAGIPKQHSHTLNIPRHIKWIIVIGTHAQTIITTLIRPHQQPVTVIDHVRTLGPPLTQIITDHHIECVLFSPGGSSTDQYNNFADRGDDFKKTIENFCIQSA